MHYICLVGINHTIWQEGSSSATFEKGIYCYALQKELPLDRPLIRDLNCLDPANKDEHWTVNATERLCIALPHMVSSSQVIKFSLGWCNIFRIYF